MLTVTYAECHNVECRCAESRGAAGNSCQGQTLQLITNIHKLRAKKFYNIGFRLVIEHGSRV